MSVVNYSSARAPRAGMRNRFAPCLLWCVMLASGSTAQESVPQSRPFDRVAAAAKAEAKRILDLIAKIRSSDAFEIAEIDREISRISSDPTADSVVVDELWIRFGLAIGQDAPPSDRTIEILQDGRRRAENRKSAAEALQLGLFAGERLIRLRRHEEASVEFLAALKIARAVGRRQILADIKFRIGTIKIQLGDFKTALEMLNEAEIDYRAVRPTHYRLQTIELFRNNALADSGDFEGAMRCLDRAEAAMNAAPDKANIEVIAQNRGRTYAAAEKFDRAVIEYANFTRTARKEGKLSQIAWSRQTLMDILGRLGAARESGAVVKRSIADNTAEAFAAACEELGSTFLLLRDPGAALRWFENAEDIYAKIDRREAAANMKRARATAYMSFQRYDLARHLLEEARNEFEALGNDKQKTECDLGIIDSYELLEDVVSVVRLIDEFLPRDRSSVDQGILIRLYLKKCRCLTHLSRLAEAEAVVDQLEPLVVSSRSKTWMNELRLVKAYLDYRSGRLDDAAAAFDAIAAERSSTNANITADDFLLRGIVLAAVGRPADALASFVELSKTYRMQILGAASLSPEVTRSLRDRVSRLPDYAMACLLENGPPKAVDLKTLYGMCQDLQARGILQQYLEREIEPREILLTDEMRLERLRSQKKQAEARRERLALRRKSDVDGGGTIDIEAREIETSIRHLAVDIERIGSRRESPSRRLFEREIAKPIDPDDIQKRIPENTVLLEFCGAYYPPIAWVWISTSDERRLVKLAEPHAIVDAVVDVNRSFSLKANAVPVAKLRDLGRRIIDPVLEQLRDMETASGKRTLLIATTDIFGFVPFELLLTADPSAPNDSGRTPETPYLIRDFDIAYVPSGSMLYAMAKREPRRPSEGPAFVGFGFPFDYDTERGGLSAEEVVALRPVVDRSIDLDRFGIDRLPGTAREVLLCAGFFAETEEERKELADAAANFVDGQKDYVRSGMKLGGSNYSVYLRNSATEWAVKNDRNVRTAQAVHFACHGLVDFETPANSALRLTLSRVDENSTGENGLLSIGELRNLDLDADLLVLAACTTAGGANSKGDGIISLAVAGLASGARSVIASRWSINDRDSVEIMTTFYRNWKKGGMSRIHALSEAKRTAIRAGLGQRTWGAYQIWDVQVD